MDAGTGDFEGLRDRHERLALERPTYQGDHVAGKVGEIAHRLVFDLGVLAITAAQKVRRVHLVLVPTRCSNDMDSGPSHTPFRDVTSLRQFLTGQQ